MSVVVGLIHNGNIYMGSDNQITSNDKKITHLNNAKIWHIDNDKRYVIGTTGTLRAMNIIKTIDKLIDVSIEEIDYKYIVRKIVPKIFDELSKFKLLDDKSETPEMYNQFLIGIKNQLYSVGLDGGVIQVNDFHCIGSGSNEAYGSLISTKKLKPAIKCWMKYIQERRRSLDRYMMH